MHFYKTSLIIILYSTCLIAQNDAIKIPKSISEERNDSLRMELLINEIDINYNKLSFEEKEAYFKMAEEIAVRQQYNIRYCFILGWTGDLYNKNNERDKSILFYKKAIKLKETLNLAIEDKEHAKLHNALSDIIQEKADDLTTVHKKELYEEAILHSKIAVKLNPDVVNAWWSFGNLYVSLANELIVVANKQTEFKSKQALYEEALSDFEKAIVAYKKALELSPNHRDIQRNMGVLYRERGKLLGRRLGRLDEAILSLETSLSYSKKDFECFRLLGVANGVKGSQLQQKGLMEQSSKSHYKAISYFEKALEINPNSATILYNLEVAYTQLGKIDKAVEYEARWKKIDPDYDPSTE